MYVIARNDNEGFVEASLGGRVTLEEMKVFGSELAEICADFRGEPFVVLMDSSGALPFDLRTRHLLFAIQDMMLNAGALQVTHLLGHDQDVYEWEALRYERVKSGAETYVVSTPDYEQLKRAA